MLVDITKIQIADRIRKDYGDIEDLAKDIKENSLLNPITVMPVDGGRYQLIAGERRLRACQSLGYTSIVVNAVAVQDAEQALRMEISENENRKEFSFSERMNWAKRLEVIEKEKALERMKNPMETFPQGATRDIVAAAVGFGSGKNYEKAKYIAENANSEIIEALDKEDITVNAAYQKAVDAQKAAEERAHILEEENKRLHNQPKPEPVTIEKTVEIIPEDYEQLKQRVGALTESERKLREKATEAENTAKAYKQYAESVKANGKEIDQISLKDFKFAVRAFMREVTPLVYLGEQFKDIKDRDREEFYSEIETIERWISDVKQALEGNSGGANLIIVEGGKARE